ncbi:MAG: DUF2817 domain-containing protein [Bdellovibrionales bacterium]
MRCRELEELEEILSRRPRGVNHYELTRIDFRQNQFPIRVVSLGEKGAPTLAFVAGVHGLERIGSDVVLAYLRVCLARLEWDSVFQNLLTKTRLVFIPALNPVGLARNTRSNGQGVDLMRNSPLDADEPGGFLYRGHRYSSWLPFYRGPQNAPMQAEALALAKALEDEVWPADLSMVIDVHSGFGAIDRVWFPYAHSRRAFPHLAEAYWLKNTFDQTYPHHFYAIEPMARQYTLHGDLWDYFYLRQRESHPERLFLPWTLEMGSWIWVKKNPGQLFSSGSIFDPVRPHRRKRILRRHLTLFDFMHRVLATDESWWHLSGGERASLEHRARECWYE